MGEEIAGGRSIDRPCPRTHLYVIGEAVRGTASIGGPPVPTAVKQQTLDKTADH